MQPQQPTTPEPAAVDAAPIEEAPEEASSSSKSSTWHNLFGLLPGKKPSADATTEGTADETPGGGQAPSPKTLTLTEEELSRRIQAETDRREAKRQRDTSAQAEQNRRAAIERKLDPNSPDYDPYAGSEERAVLQAAERSNEQFVGFIHNVQQQHDAATLDVVMGALPKPEQDRILKIEGAGVGIEGRKLIISEALRALEKRWRAEGRQAAESGLREDPIFRKRVFTEHRGDADEPELLPANGGVNHSGDFMTMLQSDYRKLKGR